MADPDNINKRIEVCDNLLHVLVARCIIVLGELLRSLLPFDLSLLPSAIHSLELIVKIVDQIDLFCRTRS